MQKFGIVLDVPIVDPNDDEQREKRKPHGFSPLFAVCKRAGIQIGSEDQRKTDANDKQQPLRHVAHAGKINLHNLPEHHGKREANEEDSGVFRSPNAGNRACGFAGFGFWFDWIKIFHSGIITQSKSRVKQAKKKKRTARGADNARRVSCAPVRHGV